jgi:DNA polymerase-1
MHTIVKSSLDFPSLSSAVVLGLDTETRDPYLIDDGPGWARNAGNIVGVSIGTIEGDAWYFPLKHTVDTQDNLPWDSTIKYLSEVLRREIPKVGANCMYDLGWLKESGIECAGPFYDVQFAEALLDGEARSYALDTLAKKYTNRGKLGNDMYEWAAKRYRGQPTGKDQGGNIYRCPPSVVGPYACEDAVLPIEIFQQQQHALEKADLLSLFLLECDLIPLLVDMRFRGMPVDVIAAEEARGQLIESELLQRDMLHDLAGFNVNVNSSKDLAKLFDKLGLSYPTTDKGNPSFVASWLDAQHNPVASLVNNIRKTNKARTTFIENAILEKCVNNKIYPSLHPLRSDGGGTITGRFSSSKPNSQQFPSRNDIMAPIIRGVFVPEAGYTHWAKMDFSQIEYRMFAHYSEDDELIEAYSQEGADFHSLVGGILGGSIPRKYVKSINFAKLYGAGTKKIREMLEAQGEAFDPVEFIKLYNEKFPAAQRLMDRIAAKAGQDREIRTILNRRTLFTQFVPANLKPGEYAKPCPYQQAFRLYGPNITVANTYKAVNYLLQGSAADLMKKGMVDAYKSGIFKKIGVPHTVVHDEYGLSYHPDLRNEFVEFKRIIENAIQLRVPVIMDCDLGPNWGAVKEFNLLTGEFK